MTTGEHLYCKHCDFYTDHTSTAHDGLKARGLLQPGEPIGRHAYDSGVYHDTAPGEAIACCSELSVADVHKVACRHCGNRRSARHECPPPPEVEGFPWPFCADCRTRHRLDCGDREANGSEKRAERAELSLNRVVDEVEALARQWAADDHWAIHRHNASQALLRLVRDARVRSL